jgi:hypothetical protein
MSTKKIKSYEAESLDSVFPEVLKGGEGSAETFKKAVARADELSKLQVRWRELT